MAMAKAMETKERILNAAEDVVLRDGVARLTLESAAAEAQLSKGGVLYHFPTRDALVGGMIRRMIDGFNEDLRLAGGGDEGDGLEPGSATRAYLRATFHPAPGPAREREDRLGAALIAAVAAQPTLLQPLQEEFERWQGELEHDGLDRDVATLVRLAADGLWLADLFGFAPPTPEQRVRLEAALEALTRRAQ